MGMLHMATVINDAILRSSVQGQTLHLKR